MMRHALLYAMPRLLAAAFKEPVSRTPMHRLAMPRPNTELLSVLGLTTESLTIGLSLDSLLMNGPSVPPRVLLFVVQGSEKPLRRALDVLGGAVDDFGELDGQTVEFRQAARHVVVARFVGDQVVEAAAGKRGNVFRQGLAGLRPMSRPVLRCYIPQG